jgi:hypothetical protein
MGIPKLEQLQDATTMRIVGFDNVNPLDRIAAPQGEQWIPAPLGPLLEPAEWPAGFEVRGILPTPSPDGQGCGQQLGSTKFDPPEKTRFEPPLLRVLASGVQLADHETARKIL